LLLVGAERRVFTGSSGFLDDQGNRARVAEYLADLARPYAIEVSPALFSDPPESVPGHSYGEMAEPLIAALVPPDDPVDLLVLAFSVHDLRPGRQTAAYLSHVTPGSPMAFAVCDQGSAAAFSGLRIAREYLSSAGARRALLIVIEQAAIPYECKAPLPAQHRAVAMLYGDGDGNGVTPLARVTGICQHPNVGPDEVVKLAAADLAELATGHRKVSLVQASALSAAWTAPDAWSVRTVPAGQPMTGVWWGLLDELGAGSSQPDSGECSVVVAADYDPGLRYLCLTAVEKEPAP
jgi:4-hydroxymandelate oxidase